MPCGRLSVDQGTTRALLPPRQSSQQFDGARLHSNLSTQHSPLPDFTTTARLFTPRDSHSSTTRTTSSPHHSIVPSQHHLLHAQFRHSSTLRIPLRRLTSNATLPPSAAVSLVHQSPLVHLRRSHARRHHSSRTGWLATPVHRQPDNFQTNSLQPCPR
jgi:hypothetical protein